MKKIMLLAVAVMMGVGFAACGAKKEETTSTEKGKDKAETVIKVAAQAPFMMDILELSRPELEKAGYQLEVVKVNDNIQYNELVNNKEIDANFAQHQPFMETYNKEKKGTLAIVQPIYNVKVGYYSKEVKDIKDILEGSKVAIPNDFSNEGRALAILDEYGIIKLKEGTAQTASVKDVVENPKKLEFLPVDLLNLAETYNEKDVSLTFSYPTYIKKVGLGPDDALFLEKTVDPRFAISLVAREDNKESPEIQALKKAMTSQTIRDFFEKEHPDDIISF